MAEVDRNLRQLLSVIVHNPTLDQCKGVIRDLRFKNCDTNPHWNYVEIVEGVYDWGWYDGVMANIMAYTKVFPVHQLFQAPAWVAPEFHPRGDPKHPWVPYLPYEKIPKWEAFVDAFMDRYKSQIDYCNFDTETNVEGIWKGTPEEYANHVLVPAAKIVHRYGKKVVAPGITIQKYESAEHYARSKDHMNRILQIALPDIDKISIHSYAKNVARTIDQTRTFIADCGLAGHKVWVTETGFPEDYYWVSEDILESIKEYGMTGEARQLKRFKEFISEIETKPFPVERWVIYRGFDTEPNEAEKHGTNGLLNWKLKQKPAGAYVKEQMMEDRPPV